MQLHTTTVCTAACSGYNAAYSKESCTCALKNQKAKKNKTKKPSLDGWLEVKSKLIAKLIMPRDKHKEYKMLGE